LVDADMAFFMVSVDHLKQSGQSLDENQDEQILAQVKGVMLTVFSETDYLIRWSNHELLVVARFINRECATELAEQLRESFATHDFTLEGMPSLKKTCSIGFACYPFEPLRPQLLNWMQLVEMSKTCLNGAKQTQENAWIGVSNNPDCEIFGIFERFIASPSQLVASGNIIKHSSINSDVQLKW
jgi:GGDEF domain-containing protein